MNDRILHLSIFFISLLVLFSLVQSFVVLSPQDATRIGREQKAESLEIEKPASLDDERPQNTHVKLMRASDRSMKSNVNEDASEDGFRSNPRRLFKEVSEMRKRVMQDAQTLFAQPFMQPRSEEADVLPEPNHFRRLITRMSAAVNDLMASQIQKNEAREHEMIDEVTGMRMRPAQAKVVINMADTPAEGNQPVFPRHHPSMMTPREAEAARSELFVNDKVWYPPRKPGTEHHYGGNDRGPHSGRSACLNDMDRLCPAESRFKSDHPQIMECLIKNRQWLTPECTAELSLSVSLQCADDALKLCPTQARASPPKSEDFENAHDSREKRHYIINCLEQNAALLSNQCLVAINKRRIRHGQSPISVINDGGDVSISPYPPMDEQLPELHSSDSGFPQWGLIAIVGASSALFFIVALSILLLIQRKRRQRQAIVDAANSLNLPAPPVDVVAAHAIRQSEDQPYHRMDEVPAI